MAQTKVKLISDGVIDVGHLASGHGITTDNIGEGSNLYYTDARVSTYLSTNNYATESWVNTNYLALSGGTLTGNLTMNGSNLIAFGNGTQYINSPDGSDLTLGAADDINFNASYMRYFNSSNVEYARLHGTSGDSWINGGGNLGINTNTPTQRLHVAGTIYTNAGNFKIDSGYELTWGNGNTSILGNTATGYLDFRTSNGTKMYIDSSGNVGVSTTSPRSKLDVNGIITQEYGNVYQVKQGATEKYYYSNGASYNAFGTGVLGIGTTGDAIQFATSNSVKATITSGGDVGIGTASPDRKLEVRSDTSGDVVLARFSNRAGTGSEGAYIGFSTGYNAEAIIGAKREGAENDSSLIFSPMLNEVANEAMRITSSGSVGIGTTTPTAKFTVSLDEGQFIAAQNKSSNISSSNVWGFGLYEGASKGAEVSLVRDGTNNQMYVGPTVSGQSLRLGYGAKDTGIYISSDGKVGIGTNAPSSKIQTSGGGYILNGGYALFGSYTMDGLFSTNARPNYLSTNGYGSTYSKYSGGNSGLLLGYQDNGAGLYSPAYGFEVKSTDGRPVGGQVVKAIVMRDVDTGVEPFWINNNGSAFFNDSISIGRTSALGGSFHVYGNTGVFQSPTNGSNSIDSNTFSLLVGPKDTRNPGSAYYGGIAFNHLLNYGGGSAYNAHPQAWVGLRLYDTSGSERSSLVFATKEGAGTTSSDVPIERMTINPFGMVGIGTSTPSQISSGVPTLTINSPNSNTLSGGVIYQANGSSQAYHYWENNFLVHQVQGSGAHKFAQGASTKFAVYSEGIDIVPGLEYSQTYTYSDAWTTSFQDVVPTGTLDGTRVYLFTIWTDSFGKPPYYAAASTIITTAQSTNSGGGGSPIDMLTAHHVGSSSIWQIQTTTAGNSTNGIQVKLLNGPTSAPTTVYIRVTMLSNF